MGSENSKPEKTDEIFKLLFEGASADKVNVALEKLKEDDPKVTLESLIHKSSGYNALMAILQPLGPDPTKTVKVSVGASPVPAFVYEDRRKYAKDILKKFDLNYASPVCGTTVLHLLAASHWPDQDRMADFVERVLVEGVNPSPRDKWDRSPLMIAAANGLELIVNELCGAGAAVNFLTKNGNSPLLSAITGGNVQCVGRILSLCNAEVKLCKFYDKNASDEKEGNASTTTAGKEDQHNNRPRPFDAFVKNMERRAASYGDNSYKRDTSLFEFLLNNNFDLSEWNVTRSKLQEASLHLTAVFTKYFSSSAMPDPIGNGFGGPGGLARLAGNSLAQACLIQNLSLFRFLVDQFNPKAPSAVLPKNATVLHVIASFKAQTQKSADAAIDFVDVVREKCAMYSETRTYDWMVRDDDGKTPLDYCIAANEEDVVAVPQAKKDRLARGYGTQAEDDAARDRVMIPVSKAFTALVLIETLKHDIALRNNNKELHLLIRQGDSDILQVLGVTPPTIAEKVTKITLEECDFTSNQLEHLAHFVNLESLVFFHYARNKDELDVSNVLGEDFREEYYAKHSEGELPDITGNSNIFLKNLKYLGIANSKVANSLEIASKKMKRNGLEIEL